MLFRSDCIDQFIKISSLDEEQDYFFSKVEHKQLSRLQQKPFEAEELIARIKTRIKQSKVSRENMPAFECKGLKVDFVGHRVFLNDKEVGFSALEFKLLSFFIRHPDRVLARDKILSSVWGETFVSDRVVDSHIRTIRKKLGAFKGHIESIYGEGYRFNPSPLSQGNSSDDDEEKTAA